MATTSRPKLKIEPTPTDKVVEFAAAVGLGFAIASAAFYYPMLPKTIPTHFGVSGAVDGWGPKSTLLMLPVIALIMYILFSVVCRFPHTFNYPVPITDENAERQYRIGLSAIRWLKMEIIWMFAYLNWQTIQVTLGKAKGLGLTFTFVPLGAIIVTTIVLVVKAYRAR